jgi:hypothetical protein
MGFFVLFSMGLKTLRLFSTHRGATCTCVGRRRGDGAVFCSTESAAVAIPGFVWDSYDSKSGCNSPQQHPLYLHSGLNARYHHSKWGLRSLQTPSVMQSRTRPITERESKVVRPTRLGERRKISSNLQGSARPGEVVGRPLGTFK